jgi:hypothetical protein
MTSPAAVLDLIRRGRSPMGRVAIVTAVTAGPPMVVSVRFIEGGPTFQPDVLAQAALPAVGARALILPVEDGRWVFAGTVTAPSAPAAYYTLEAPILGNWWKGFYENTGGWDGFWDRLSSPLPYVHAMVEQGAAPPMVGDIGGWTPVNPPLTISSTILDHGIRAKLDAIAAGGGTVHMVELVATRGEEGTAPYVSPVMYGHDFTLADPPVAAGAPVWVPGFGPTRLAPLAKEQRARWILPVEWVTALATGVLTGIGFYSDTTADYMALYSFVEAARNARLVITYTAPSEVLA